MDDSDKKVSKVYRKILTSNHTKAYMVYEKLSDEMKVKVKQKMIQNGSVQAQKILEQLF